MVKASRFELRAEPEQLERWKAAAEMAGRSLADWLANVADAASCDVLSLLPKPREGLFLTVSRKADQKMLDQFRHALSYAIKSLGGASPDTDAMEEILHRIERPAVREREGLAFSPGQQDLIRRAQVLSARKDKR